MKPVETPDPHFELSDFSNREWIKKFEAEEHSELLLEEMDLRAGDCFQYRENGIVERVLNIDPSTAECRVRVVDSGRKETVDLFEIYTSWRQGKINPAVREDHPDQW